jgi:uncharacterized protein YecE (DUF72 family)
VSREASPAEGRPGREAGPAEEPPALGRQPPRGTAHIGCSGWSYADWRGVVYPAALRPRDWLGYYTKLFGTVEVNNTFYRLPPAATFAGWAAQAPPGFVYALKVNRFGTHQLKLASPERWLPAYMERAALLGPALGPNLVQLPPRWHKDVSRLARFLEAAAEMSADIAVKQGSTATWRWALEVRDSSWLDDAVYEVLAEHTAALCWHDMLPDHPWVLTASTGSLGAGWAYARFHGPRAPADKYAGEYGPDRLRPAAAKLRAWLVAGCDVYAYFNNDQGGAATRDAATLRSLLDQAPHRARRANH